MFEVNRVDVVKAVPLLKEFANELKVDIKSNKLDNNAICISNVIYAACKTSYKKKEIPSIVPATLCNCNSMGLKVIAETNLHTILSNMSSDFESYSIYLENWIKYEKLALQAEHDELNLHLN